MATTLIATSDVAVALLVTAVVLTAVDFGAACGVSSSQSPLRTWGLMKRARIHGGYVQWLRIGTLLPRSTVRRDLLQLHSRLRHKARQLMRWRPLVTSYIDRQNPSRRSRLQKQRQRYMRPRLAISCGPPDVRDVNRDSQHIQEP